MYSALGNYEQALEACRESLSICQENKLVERECETLAAMITLYDKFPDREADPEVVERQQVLECD